MHSSEEVCSDQTIDELVYGERLKKKMFAR